MDRKPSMTLETQRSASSSSNSTTVSGNSTPAVVHHELIEDEDLTPLDLECVIQTERIAKLLEHAIYKTKLSLCLPILMRERQTLASLLLRQDLEEVSFIFEQYVNPLLSTSTTNMNALEDLESGNYSLKHRLNPELAHLLYILNKYKELGPTVEAMIRDMKLERETNNGQVPPLGFEYLTQLELFYGQVTSRNRTKAADELRAFIQTRKLEKTNVKLVERIKEYEDAIKNENEAFESDLRNKKELINKMEFQLGMMRQTSAAVLKGKVRDYDRQMVLRSRSHRVRHEMLMEEETESRETYKLMLNKDIMEEVTHRQRRRKLETQLLSWIQKYDMDMLEKQTELDELCAIYDDEAAKVADLEVKLEEQDVEYLKLMKEKDDEYQEELTEKMNLFMVAHAARVVQEAWRDTVANRDEKKKLRNLLKKRQQAAEAAARAAELQEKKEAAAAKKAAAAAKKQAREELRATKKAEKAAKEAEKAEKAKQVKSVKEEDKEQ